MYRNNDFSLYDAIMSEVDFNARLLSIVDFFFPPLLRAILKQRARYSDGLYNGYFIFGTYFISQIGLQYCYLYTPLHRVQALRNFTHISIDLIVYI